VLRRALSRRQAARRGRRARRLHVDPRHDDRQRRARDAGARPGRPARRRPVGRHGVPARPRGGHPRHGVGRPARGLAQPLHLVARALHGRLGPLRPGLERRVARRLPGPAGDRRRDDHAGRPDGDGADRGPPEHGPRHGGHRRADRHGARPGPRPGRDPRAGALLGVDLLRQRPRGHRRGARRPAAVPPRGARARRPARRGRARPAGHGAAADDLRPHGARHPGDAPRRPGARPARGRPRADRAVRGPRAALGPSAARPAPLRQPRVRGRGHDDVRPGRRALRRAHHRAALLPGAAHGGRDRHGPAARAAGDRGRAGHAALGLAHGSLRRRAGDHRRHRDPRGGHAAVRVRRPGHVVRPALPGARGPRDRPRAGDDAGLLGRLRRAHPRPGGGRHAAAQRPAADRRLVRHGDPHGGPDHPARGRRLAAGGRRRLQPDVPHRGRGHDAGGAAGGGPHPGRAPGARGPARGRPGGHGGRPRAGRRRAGGGM
ncbi:MAG: Uncharacterized MFS-type transporter, partial [uncultured Solirubrobacteraceae bacterium]